VSAHGAHEHRDDDALVAAVRGGDDRAFGVLYRRYHAGVAAYARGMLRNDGRVEDVAQDVFVSALRRLRATDAPIAFRPWIHEIAKNACIDAWRRSSRAELVSYDDEGFLAGDRVRLVSAAPGPDAEVATRLEIEQLKGAFEGLSDAHHEILVMRELHGYSYREIAERLGLTAAAVESRLFGARRRLGEELEELGTGKACRRSRTIIASAGGTGRVAARAELRLAGHVTHCRACRRAAALAGFDLSALASRKGRRAKIAALVPLPAWVRPLWPGAGGGPGAAAGRAVEAARGAALGGEQVAQGAGKILAGVGALAVVAGLGAGTATQINRWTGSEESARAGAPAPAKNAARAHGAGATTAAGRRGATDPHQASAAATHATATSGTGRAVATASGTVSSTGAGASAVVAGPTRDAVPGAGQRASGAVGPATTTAVAVTGTATDAARPVAGTATGTEGAVTGTATDTARSVTGTATDTARSVSGKAKGTPRSVAGRANNAAGSLAGKATKPTGSTTTTATNALGRVKSSGPDRGAANSSARPATRATPRAVGPVAGGGSASRATDTPNQ
jgi:RNA polymerase sigma factor (sigma-70 family)